MEVDCCKHRLMLVRLHGTPVGVVVKIVYIPTNDHEGEEADALYGKIEES